MASEPGRAPGRSPNHAGYSIDCLLSASPATLGVEEERHRRSHGRARRKQRDLLASGLPLPSRRHHPRYLSPDFPDTLVLHDSFHPYHLVKSSTPARAPLNRGGVAIAIGSDDREEVEKAAQILTETGALRVERFDSSGRRLAE